ncbi:hypothetical protein P8452_71430 [Trifolium repens]|nr:hypothetical protein P8452_71430 [Trifolium repens]
MLMPDCTTKEELLAEGGAFVMTEGNSQGQEQIGFALSVCLFFTSSPKLYNCNLDEIPFHFIDCIHNHLCTKVKTEEGIPSTFTPSNSSMNTPVKSALNGSQAPPSNPI